MAVGSHKELITWQMKVYPQTYSKKKLRKIWRTIECIILKYGITIIAMKLPPQYSRSDGLSQTLKYITEKASEKDIILFFYDLQTIEAHFLKPKSDIKSALPEKMAEKYPELKRESLKKGKSHHNMKLFEAVASLELALSESLK